MGLLALLTRQPSESETRQKAIDEFDQNQFAVIAQDEFIKRDDSNGIPRNVLQDGVQVSYDKAEDQMTLASPSGHNIITSCGEQQDIFLRIEKDGQEVGPELSQKEISKTYAARLFYNGIVERECRNQN